VAGAGKLIGVGNGDPTSHESDIGSARKAFSGLCMGIVQAGKETGTITVEVTSPGLAAASAAVAVKPCVLRPQVADWERKVPAGPGVTGLWRPGAAETPSGPDPLQLALAGDTLYTLMQNGSTLTGTLEAPAGGFGPGASAGPGPIEGTIDGRNITFHVGTTTYSGTVNGERIELRRTAPPRPGVSTARAADTGPHPVIGPPPDGSDPSLNFGRGQAQSPIVLRRVSR